MPGLDDWNAIDQDTYVLETDEEETRERIHSLRNENKLWKNGIHVSGKKD